jgi:hypothetical protein
MKIRLPDLRRRLQRKWAHLPDRTITLADASPFRSLRYYRTRLPNPLKAIKRPLHRTDERHAGGFAGDAEIHMARDFYPRQQLEILTFTRHFREQIEADPGAYGVSPEQCAQYAVTQQAFADALMIAIDPVTATRSKRTVKDAAGAALEEATRFLARIIRAHPGVTTVMRVELGLSETNPGDGGSAIAPPTEQPTVLVKSIAGPQIQIELRDDAHKRRKPAGVIGALLFVSRADQPSPNLSDWTFMEIATRARETLTFGPEFGAGEKVWVMAQWFSPTGARGPSSRPVHAYLQGGLVMPANLASMAA